MGVRKADQADPEDEPCQDRRVDELFLVIRDRMKAPTSAPAPTADISVPWVVASPRIRSRATAGIIVTKAAPNSDDTATSISETRIWGFEKL